MPAGDDDVTPGELRRNIKDMREDFQRALNNIERRLADIDDLPYLRKDVYDADQKTATADHKARGERMGRIEADVSGIKTTLTKISFTAWTGVILPIGTAIFIAIILAAVNLG